MEKEIITLTSGKEVTAFVSPDGEVAYFSWWEGNNEKPSELTENEVFELHDWLEEYGEPDEDNDSLNDDD